MSNISHFRLLKIIRDKNRLIRPKETSEILKLMKVYSLTLKEATLFTFLLGKYIENSRVSLSDFESENIKTGNDHYLDLLKTLKSLARKNIVILERKRGYSELLDPSIDIDEGVFSTIVLGEELFYEVDFSDTTSILEAADSLLSKRENEKVSSQRLFNEFSLMISKINKELPLYPLVSKYSLIEGIMIFKAMTERIKGNRSVDCAFFSSMIYDSLSETARFMRKVYSHDMLSIKDGVLELEENSMFRSQPDFDITDKHFEKVLNAKFKNKLKKEPDTKYTSIIKYKNIRNELFFDKDISQAVDTITRASSPSKFKTINKELKKAGLASGLVILLHGYPGTGKTATVHEIAKRSKRNIVQVDISNIKDKFVGESEKRLKKVFKEYEKAKEYYKTDPVLLFNEADALISKRIGVEDSVDQMYNNLQNILLEQLENFDGIFFATTNLTQNMDEAFDRRFLYKIEYKKPSGKTRKKIWASKLKDLPEELITQVSAFDLTGGQIENIVRKYMIDRIIKTGTNDKELIQMCRLESSFKKENYSIGF